QLRRRFELLEDQLPLEPQDDAFDRLWLPGVARLAAYRIIEDFYHIDDLVPDVGLRRVFAPMEEVEELHLKTEPVASDDDVSGVKVAMVVAVPVHVFDRAGQGVEEVQALERVEALAGLLPEKLEEDLAF